MRNELLPSNFVVPFRSAVALPSFCHLWQIFSKGPGFFLLPSSIWKGSCVLNPSIRGVIQGKRWFLPLVWHFQFYFIELFWNRWQYVSSWARVQGRLSSCCSSDAFDFTFIFVLPLDFTERRCLEPTGL